MLDAAEIEAVILEMAEEDRYGLYEIIWSLNVRHPDISEEAKVAAARPVVAALVQKARISLGRERSGEIKSEAEISLSDTQRTLQDPLSWQPGEEFVFFDQVPKAGGAA